MGNTSDELLSMSPEEYMRDRVDHQLTWYGRKSAINKRLHHRINGTVIVLAAIIPALSGFSDGPYGFWLRIGIAVLGVAAAALTGISSLYKFQDKWTTYRMTSEALLREKILYKTATKPYNNPSTAHSIFVPNVERILANENVSWNELISTEQ